MWGRQAGWGAGRSGGLGETRPEPVSSERTVGGAGKRHLQKPGVGPILLWCLELRNGTLVDSYRSRRRRGLPKLLTPVCLPGHSGLF